MITVAIVVGLIVLVVLGVCLVQGITLSKKDFVCPKCSHRFQNKWYELIFLTHYENEFSVKCPECSSKRTRAVDREK